MKNIKIALIAITLAGGLLFSASAAEGEYSITNDFPIQGIDAGRLWVGNFGTNGGSLLSKSQVESADWFQLFSTFRPNTSFELSGGLLTGLTNGERTGLFQLGTAISYNDEGGIQGYTPDTATQFAGQDLYFFALNSTATTWNSTLLGNTYQALLLGMLSGFSDGEAASGLSSYDISANPAGVNTTIIGSGSATTIVSATVPEPATGSLLLLSVAAALAARRRKV
ncbi:MAG: PEP-CTERM sorting domain-containing protein [Candidatus Pacebacteria bacterium]|nr:PEP-CTERM sorting domain-containing protein [Candidatus Paceibacterota bacterium]